jgi:hypothetical protein
MTPKPKTATAAMVEAEKYIVDEQGGRLVGVESTKGWARWKVGRGEVEGLGDCFGALE